jgi:hypothetical protein
VAGDRGVEADLELVQAEAVLARLEVLLDIRPHLTQVALAAGITPEAFNE